MWVYLREEKEERRIEKTVGIGTSQFVIKKARLRRFGHVEHKDDTDWIKCCTAMAVEGTKPRGRPRKTWWDGVKEGMKKIGLSHEDAQPWTKWRRKIKRPFD